VFARVGVYASSACYFIALALFPSLVLLLGLLRYTGLEVRSLISMLEGVLPQALMPQAKQLVINTYMATSGTLVSVSALTALWSASRGVYGLIKGLNAAYRVEETRGYLRTRLMSVGYTFAFLMLLVLNLILQVFGAAIFQALPQTQEPVVEFFTEAVDVRILLLLLVQTGLFAAMYKALPNCENTWAQSLPGAVLASFGWLIFSNFFSLYVTYFPRYANIYGAVYTVALSMLWLYCCICIVFYGGALNRYLRERGYLFKNIP
jgi:membrane protein